jgi:lipid A 3-O-deacylase
MTVSLFRVLAVFLSFFSLLWPRVSSGQIFQEDPPLLSAGVGYFDVVRQDDTATDFRLEYRHNKGLWIFRPWLGVEATTDGSLFGVVGFETDFHLGERIIFTPSFGAGAYHQGSGPDLGSVLEFRSQIEVAYRFDDASRIGVAFSHFSNAGIGSSNQGTEIATIYYSVPIDF